MYLCKFEALFIKNIYNSAPSIMFIDEHFFPRSFEFFVMPKDT